MSATYQATISTRFGAGTRHAGATRANQTVKAPMACASQPATWMSAPPPGTCSDAATQPASPTGTTPSSASGTTTMFETIPAGASCAKCQAPIGAVATIAAADAAHSRSVQRPRRSGSDPPAPRGAQRGDRKLVPAAAANESWNDGSNSSSGDAHRITSAASASACAAVARRRTATAPSHANATMQERTVATSAPVKSV
jgi:hypothetical protein